MVTKHLFTRYFYTGAGVFCIFEDRELILDYFVNEHKIDVSLFLTYGASFDYKRWWPISSKREIELYRDPNHPVRNIELSEKEVLQEIKCFHIFNRYKKLKYTLRLQRNFRCRYYSPNRTYTKHQSPEIQK